MAPKRPMVAMGKAKAKAKAKVLPRPKRAVAKAGGRVRRRPALRRPGVEIEEKKGWTSGDILLSHEIVVDELNPGDHLMVEEGTYKGAPVQILGRIARVEKTAGGVEIGLELRGSQSEEILQWHSSHPTQLFKVHCCEKDCDQTVMREDLAHATKMRKVLDLSRDVAWGTCLDRVVPPVEDEMAELRARGEGLTPGDTGVKEDKKRRRSSSSRSRSRRRRRKKDKKDRRRRRDKSRERGAERRSERRKPAEEAMVDLTGKGQTKLDGRHAAWAQVKDPQVIFGGTGMDPKEKVRHRVLRRAQKLVSKKTVVSSSKSSGSESKSETDEDSEDVEMKLKEGIYLEGSKVRLVSERYPGALACELLTSMRSSLITELGEEDMPGKIKPLCVAYYRQHLQRKASGPMARELLTLASAIDAIVRGKISGGLDILCQRMKATEMVCTGSHWTVAQKVEVLPTDSATLTKRPELSNAQKEAYAESKVKFLASQPEGRRGKGKGDGKKDGKNDRKGDDKKGSKGDKKEGKQ